MSTPQLNGISLCIKTIEIDGMRIIKGSNQPVQGWYFPEFGKRFENPTVIFERGGNIPFRFGYLIVPELAKEVDISCSQDDEVEVRIDECRYVIKYKHDELSLKRAGK